MESTASTISIENYRNFYESQTTVATRASMAYVGRRLVMTYVQASDGDSGLRPHVVFSDNDGATWSEPDGFGPELDLPREGYMHCLISGVLPDERLLFTGSYTQSGIQTSGESINWRPGGAIIGVGTPEDVRFQTYPSGTFMGEQFVEGLVMTPSGRAVVEFWGAKERGDNWECGVLLSDDYKEWRYVEVGNVQDKSLRDRPHEPIGFNEQTMFVTGEGKLVSIIRGRQNLGLLIDRMPRETYYFRSESVDNGETWSKPETTNLSGTGAPTQGLCLEDGSLIMVARVPHHVEMTWIKPEVPGLYGLHLVRSQDEGRNWETLGMLHHDPDGNPFDNYYSIMNGQFLRKTTGEWIYTFGQYNSSCGRRRILSFELVGMPGVL